MIKEFFFPEKIKDYYLFKKRIIALHATQSTWFAVGLELYKEEKKIFFTDKESIETFDKKLEALQKLKDRLPRCHSIITDIDYNYLIFKELIFPNLERDKINLALPLELEQLLPFTLYDTQSNFTLFDYDSKKYALIALIQKKYLQESELFFAQAELSIDFFIPLLTSVYGLFQNTIDPENNHLLIIFDEQVVYVSYIKNGILTKIRTLTQKMDGEISEKLQLTLSSLLEEEGKIDNCYCIGEIPESIRTYLQTTITKSIKILTLQDTPLKNESENSLFEQSLSLATLALCYPSTIAQNTSLQSEQIQQKNEKSIINTLILTGILLFSSIALFSTVTIMQVKKLSQQIIERNSAITNAIKKNFNKIKKTSTLREIIKNAQKEIEKEEKVWLPFSQQTHQSFLKDLLALSTHIDSQVLGLEIKRMVLTKNTMNIEGSVRNFEAIEEFEKQLKATKLFKRVPDLQETQFSLILPFAEKGEML